MPKHHEHHESRGFSPGLTALAALVLGAVLIGLASASTPLSDQTSSPVPVVAPSRPFKAGEPEPGRGFVPPAFDLPEIEAPVPGGALPLVARFDWRESGKVTPVKNQGACGACYAFASAANFESRMLIDGEGALDISENNIKECEYFGSSCSGGNYWRVANLLAAKGTVLEACDPYVASDVACKSTCAYRSTLLDWGEFSHDIVPAAATIKAYLQTYGPIYTTMNAGHGDAWATEFNRYDGSYTLYTTATGTPNHAVLIVGWDDNLVHAGGQGAWIVKNSWGTGWGGTCGYGTERGYFTIAYGSAAIGSWSSFVTAWQDYDSDGSLLYYDEAGCTSSVGYSTTTAWGLVKFIPSEDVILKRVEFWTTDATTDVDVYVYDSFVGGTLSGLLASKLNSSFDLPGYHSVEFVSSPRVASGNDVYVVVKLTDASYKYPVVYDATGPKSPGTSYISYNGTSWSAWAAGDLGIRLRVTKDVACGGAIDKPVIVTVRDVPGDNGSTVRLAWTKSRRDAESGSPQVKRYKVWREIKPQGLVGASGETADGATAGTPSGPYEQGENGPAWELAGTVKATEQCNYSLDVHTVCDSSPGNPCWTKFYVSAQTGVPGQHFDSPVDSGYSVDNLLAHEAGPDPGRPLPPGPDTVVRATQLGTPEPNPTAQGFVIRYDLAASGWYRLEVYDITGRLVATLADEYANAGKYQAGWDGRTTWKATAAPGIYFVRLLTQTETRTAKLVLVR